MDQDGTVIEEKIKYPHDIELLNDVREAAVRLVSKGKRLLRGISWAVDVLVNKGKKIWEKLYHAYQFWKQKRDQIRDSVKSWMIDVWESLNKNIEVIKEVIEEQIAEATKKGEAISEWIVALQKKIEYHIEISKKILSQQQEMLAKGTKTVKDRNKVFLRSSHIPDPRVGVLLLL